MELTIESKKALSDGSEIPRFGLGVFLAPDGDETENAVCWAIEAGYRHIDTAAIYRNEESVGKALKACGVPREELFITTKVWNDDQGYESTKAACRESLRKLQIESADLYLVHWPNDERTEDTWRAMIELREEGLCRSIGVSNFGPTRIKKLLASSDVPPVVNQIEMNVFQSQLATRTLCREHGIAVEAYAPLSQGRKLDHPAVAVIADKYGKSPAQVMIRWVLQHDCIVFPKSVHKERIIENADVFSFVLEDADVAALDALNEDLILGWRPDGWQGEV